MCLITKQNIPETLTKKLTVYKKVELLPVQFIDDDGDPELSCSSSSQGFEYTFGKLYETNITTIDLDTKLSPGATAHADDIVGNHYRLRGSNSHDDRVAYLKRNELIVYAEGFHFHKTLKRAYAHGIDKDYVIVECTIPKGSQVYYDETDLGVANKIIINKVISKNV